MGNARQVKQELSAFVRFKSRELIDDVLANVEADLTEKIKTEVREILHETETIESLKSGDLRSDFGLQNARQRSNELIEAIVNSFKLERRQTRRNRFGTGTRVRVAGITDDFNNLIYQPFAVQVTEKGTPLEWVRWLLLEGRSLIVSGYNVVYTKFGRSRRPGIMIPRRNGFRVRRQFAGTRTNNFITRALKSNQRRQEKLLQRIVVEAARKVRQKR